MVRGFPSSPIARRNLYHFWKKAKPGKVNIKALGPWCVLLKPWEFRHLSCNFHYLNQNCFNCFYRTSCIKELSHHSYILAHQWNDQKRIYSFCIQVRYFQLLLKRLSNKFGPLKFLCFLFLLLSSSSLKYLLVNCIIYIYIWSCSKYKLKIPEGWVRLPSIGWSDLIFFLFPSILSSHIHILRKIS